MTMAYTDDEIRRQLRLGEDSAWEFKSVDFAAMTRRGASAIAGPTRSPPSRMPGRRSAARHHRRRRCARNVPQPTGCARASGQGDLQNSIKPTIRIETYRRELDERSFLLVSIPEGDAQYDSPGGSFVRVGSAKQPMSPDERMRLAQRRGQARFTGFDEQTVAGTASQPSTRNCGSPCSALRACATPS